MKKTCRQCKISKQISEFYKAKGNTDGHMNTCKVCCNNNSKLSPEQKKRRAEIYKQRKHDPTFIKSKRDRYERSRTILRRYKILCGCSICGWKRHHAGLQFDHIIPRSSTGDSKIHSPYELRKQKDNIRVLCGGCNSAEAYDQGLLQNRKDNPC